ncbi:mitochondrial 54S ribosomal protein mL54 MRPL37 [Sporobolomyces koalae]|uniref:mitochondrial 54S ribosomal protein mL54 MRPL37 n=1 Tax=Sporobolomyces koalae TaxID=500713 RepID=UPI00317FA838
MLKCTCNTVQRLAASSRVRTFASTRSIFAPSPASTSALSSCPEGTVMKGLNYLKDESPVLSKPDSEYPAWLWSLAPAAAGSDGSNVASKKVKAAQGSTATILSESELEAEQLRRNKKALKLAGRSQIKASNALRG